MSPALCAALIAAWEGNTPIGSLPEEEKKELLALMFVPLKMSARAFIAERNVMANNSMWDGNKASALRYLRQYALRDKKAVQRPRMDEIRKGSQATGLGAKLSRRLRERKARRAWNVCK